MMSYFCWTFGRKWANQILWLLSIGELVFNYKDAVCFITFFLDLLRDSIALSNDYLKKHAIFTI